MGISVQVSEGDSARFALSTQRQLTLEGQFGVVTKDLTVPHTVTKKRVDTFGMLGFGAGAAGAGCSWNPAGRFVIGRAEINFCDVIFQVEQCSDEFKTNLRQFLSPDGLGFATTPEAVSWIQGMGQQIAMSWADALDLMTTFGGTFDEADINNWLLGMGVPNEVRADIVRTMMACVGWITELNKLYAGDNTTCA